MSDFRRQVGRDLFDAAVAEGEARLARRAAAESLSGSDAMERACAKLPAAARHSTHRKIKRRARDYLQRPMEMDSIDARLPYASPKQMIAIAEHHLDDEVRRRPRRLFGHGGEVPVINAMAVRVAARWRQRFDFGDVATIAAE